MDKTFGLFSVNHNQHDSCLELLNEDLNNYKRLQKEGNPVKHYIELIEKEIIPSIEKAKQKQTTVELLIKYNCGTPVEMITTYPPVDKYQVLPNYFIGGLDEDTLVELIRFERTKQEAKL